jgi:hypothetical protein
MQYRESSLALHSGFEAFKYEEPDLPRSGFGLIAARAKTVGDGQALFLNLQNEWCWNIVCLKSEKVDMYAIGYLFTHETRKSLFIWHFSNKDESVRLHLYGFVAQQRSPDWSFFVTFPVSVAHNFSP